MNIKKYILALCAVSLVALLQQPLVAQVIPMSVEDLYGASDSVVHGTVVEQRSSSWKNKLYTISTIQVSEDFKGSNKSGTVDVVSLGGSVGPITSMALNQADLNENEEVVVFVQKPTVEKNAKSLPNVEIDPDSPFHTNHAIIGGYQGKFKLAEKSGESTDKAKAGQKSVERISPGRALRSGADRPTADDFLVGLRSLKSRFQEKSNAKTKTIPSVGKINTIKRQTDLGSLRFFDPVNVKAIEKNLKASKSASSDSAEGTKE